jgi:DNA-binding NarL/FixJ family response regulator
VVVQTVTESEALLHPDERRRLTWLGLHLEAALRLRLRPQALKAVVGPTGQLVHHETGAPPKVVLEQELSVVERPIGTRPHYHFFENPPHRQPFHVLSTGEQDAIAAICRAQTNKSAAYELGISEGALSLRLAAAASKLGLSTRMELVRIAAMLTRDPRARFERITLTPSEEHVLELVGQGLSNDQIAKIRLRSTRTIANQVASLLKKTKSATRKALVVKAERFRNP